jgi:hypothetical protein
MFLSALQALLQAVKELQEKPRGFGARVKEIIKLSSTAEGIAEHRTRIQELRTNFMAYKFILSKSLILMNVSSS